MFCIKCGKDNGDNNKFCIECGEPLPDSSEFEQVENNNYEEPSSANANIDRGFHSVSPKKIGSDTGTTILGDDTRVILTRSDGEEFKIASFPASVGKGSAADIIVDGDESISRQHFCIHEYGNNNFAIEDLNSTNKTYINNNVLEPEELVTLNDDDQIKVGETLLTVEII